MTETGESSSSSFMLELLENIQMKIEKSEEAEESIQEPVLQISTAVSIKKEEIEDTGTDFQIEEWSEEPVLQMSAAVSIKEEKIEIAEFQIDNGAGPSNLLDAIENIKKEEYEEDINPSEIEGGGSCRARRTGPD